MINYNNDDDDDDDDDDYAFFSLTATDIWLPCGSIFKT